MISDNCRLLVFQLVLVCLVSRATCRAFVLVFIQMFMYCFIIKFFPSSDAAMETDEGEKEVPPKKPKTEPVLVRHCLESNIKYKFKDNYYNVPFYKQNFIHYKE